MAPRPYDLGRRRATTEATRTQILEAARAIVRGQGDLDRFSMEAVAERAGVARMTVYYQFESRAGLLDALADYMAVQGGMSRLAEAFEESDPRRALQRFVEVFVHFWAWDRDAMRRLRAMGVAFPGRYGGPRSRDEWRREAAGNLLAKLGHGRSASSPRARRREVDWLATLTSFETFDSLCCTDRPPDVVVELITNALACILSVRDRRNSPRSKH